MSIPKEMIVVEMGELASELHAVRNREHYNARGESIAEKQRGIAALDLAIRIAEAVKANPNGFKSWFKLTMGVELDVG